MPRKRTYNLQPILVGHFIVVLFAVDHPATTVLICRVLPHGADSFFEKVVGAIWIKLACKFNVIVQSRREWKCTEEIC